MTRIWLITGANSGFGGAFTRAALNEGDRVVATVRSPETLDGLEASYPGRLTVVRLDVRDAAQCAQAVDTALRQHGHIDVLVNNAGYAITGAVEETSEEEFRDAMDVMFHAPVRLTRLVLPHMRARRSGTIVQVSSMGGLLAFAGVSAYCAAKGALEQTSEALAAEVQPLGINVLVIEPGAFRTELTGSSMRKSPPLPDYADTAGVTRANLSASYGTEPGDPDQAARSLLEVLNLSTRPFRLALGDDAVSAIHAKLKSVADDLRLAAPYNLTT